MYNDRSISSPLNHHQRGSPSGSISDWRNIKFSKIYGSSSPVGSGSIERLNTSSLNRGKDGIFRPKTIFQSATQIDFDSLANSRARILPSRGMTPIQANPRLAHLHNYHRHNVREPSLTRTSSDCAGVTRYLPSSSSTTNSGRSTPTRSTDFYSNFNDNLSYLNHSHSRPGSLSSSNYSTNLALSTTTSPYIPGKYKFTTAYYAPKYRDRPLLSNLNLKFGAKGIGNNSSSLVRTGASASTGSNKGSISSSSPSSSTQRKTNSSSVNSSHNNSVSSNESSSVKQKPALERNKFLIKFREHEPLNHQSLERRRSSISWDIPNDYQRLDFANKTATESIQEEEPNTELDTLSNKTNDNGVANSQDNKNDSTGIGLTRWKGSFDLSEDESTATKNQEEIANKTAEIIIENKKHSNPTMVKENIIVNGSDNCLVLLNQQNELKKLKLPKFSVDIKANKSPIGKKKKQVKPLDNNKDEEIGKDGALLKKTKSLKVSTSDKISPSKAMMMTNAFIPCSDLTTELNLANICLQPTDKV